MSETYTIGGDTYQPLHSYEIFGQTFTPKESHIIYFFDADLWIWALTLPRIFLMECDPFHTPLGEYLAFGFIVTIPPYLPPAKRRVRFQLDRPVTLLKGHIYAMCMHKFYLPDPATNYWLFDKDDGAYPGGHIIFSDDNAITWQHFLNHDFIFAEFGDPPLPEPDPIPPISHFSTLSLEYEYHPNAITFTLATSVPCHLFCYYTDIQPRKHPRDRVIRGALLPWGNYFCFVAWKLVEQTELGDTIYHTFEMPDWSYCQVKWFTFKGSIIEVDSTSIGPIIKHHHPGYNLVDVILRPNAPGDLCRIDGQAGPACPDHYLCIDDIIPDEDTTWVGRVTSGLYQSDLYNLPSLPPQPYAINKITIYSRARRLGSYPYGIPFLSQLKTHGYYYNHSFGYLTWDYENYAWELPVNPSTSEPWTITEVNDLQVGLSASCWRNADVKYASRTTQIYVVVETIQPGPP